MKRFFYALLLLIFAVSCKEKNGSTIVLSIENAPDSSEVVISKLAINKIVPLDTVMIKSSKMKYTIPLQKGSPEFVYINYMGRKITSMVALPSEKVTIVADAHGNVTSFEGSEESIRLRQLEEDAAVLQSKFDSLSKVLEVAHEKSLPDEQKRISTQIGGLYVGQKRKSIKYIYDHPKSFTVIPVIYQKITPELPIFAEITDVLLFQKVYDSLQPLYPSSPYIISLADEITRRKNKLEMREIVSSAREVSFPDVSLMDISARPRTLSDYEGKVIILLFSVISDDNQKVFNADLKELYDDYSYRGLEIYQISLDSEKTIWASQVKQQALPWVCVYDPEGAASPNVAMYNVEKVPAMFIISKNGSMVAKDIYDINSLERVIATQIR